MVIQFVRFGRLKSQNPAHRAATLGRVDYLPINDYSDKSTVPVTLPCQQIDCTLHKPKAAFVLNGTAMVKAAMSNLILVQDH
uniref:Uncharacterized protein n=1 Tax=Romanomermis culicivorax TaxID=13658 RepID=A0A915K1C9_ROMCU